MFNSVLHDRSTFILYETMPVVNRIRAAKLQTQNYKSLLYFLDFCMDYVSGENVIFRFISCLIKNKKNRIQIRLQRKKKEVTCCEKLYVLSHLSQTSFSTDQVEDFWQFVRGHDILSAICFYDLSAKAAYRDTGGYKINREFEKDLVAVYDISLFSRTELFIKMKEADLLESC